MLVGVAASRTKIFRNQNHRFQFKFAYCKLFGVYAGVIALTQCLSAGLQLRSSHETLRFCGAQIRNDQEMK